MIEITINVQQTAPTAVEGDPWLILPRPFNDWHNRYCGAGFSGVSEVLEQRASNSQQSAYLVKPANHNPPLIRYRFEPASANPAQWVWHVNDNRYSSASTELRFSARHITRDCVNQAESVRCLIEHAAERFDYEHPQQRFNHGLDEVPMLCGTTRGSCVDMNTYIQAMALSLNIPVQYMAGYWFHPEKTETRDMHCWLVFKADGETLFWDLAHHLKWGVSELKPMLNPAGGRRVVMSCGRGLRFQTPNGLVEISHFSEPLWVYPDGSTEKPELNITIDENKRLDQRTA